MCAIDRGYRERFEPLERAGLIRLPFIPEGVEIQYETFYIVLNNPESRTALIDHLRQNGVTAVFHFVPLHSAPMGSKFGYRVGDLPITEDLSSRLLRLPSFAAITEAEQDRVAELVAGFLRARPARRRRAATHSSAANHEERGSR
jgi:dTDP-4-amino-4,6-dideoxygalactose transaminase